MAKNRNRWPSSIRSLPIVNGRVKTQSEGRLTYTANGSQSWAWLSKWQVPPLGLCTRARHFSAAFPGLLWFGDDSRASFSGDPQALASPVERTVHELNADLPVFGVTTLKSSMQLGSIFERLAGTFRRRLFWFTRSDPCGGGYLRSGSLTRRASARVRLPSEWRSGLSESTSFGWCWVKGLLLTLSGLGAGIAVSLALTRFLKSVLFGVTATDLVTYVAVALLLCLVSLVASYIPARRAAKVDPMVALRYE